MPSFSKSTSPSCFGERILNSPPEHSYIAFSRRLICSESLSPKRESSFPSTRIPSRSISRRTSVNGSSISKYKLSQPSLRSLPRISFSIYTSASAHTKSADIPSSLPVSGEKHAPSQRRSQETSRSHPNICETDVKSYLFRVASRTYAQSEVSKVTFSHTIFSR